MRPVVRRLRLDLPALLAGLVLAFSLFGDSLLYAVLPVHAEALGIPLVLVGLLLSVNRWVRLVSNPLAVHVMRRIGVFRALALASAVAVLTSLAYAFPSSLFLLLGARVLWGVCWSHLRLGGYLVVIHTARERLGLAMGSMKAVARLGSAATLLAGGLLVDRMGYSGGVAVMALLSAGGLPVVFLLRAWFVRRGYRLSVDRVPARGAAPRVGEAGRKAVLRDRKRQALLCHAAGFVNNLVAHGLVVGSLALLLRQRVTVDLHVLGLTLGVSALSGVLLASRWLSAFAIAPAMGYLSDRWARRPLLLAGFAVEGLALLLIGWTQSPGWTVLGALILFAACNSLDIVLHAAVADAACDGSAAGIMSAFATFSDMGAAAGPLIGYLLAGLIGFPVTYTLGAAAVLVLWVILSIMPPGAT